MFAEFILADLDLYRHVDAELATLMFNLLGSYDVSYSLASSTLAPFASPCVIDACVIDTVSVVSGEPDKGLNGSGQFVGCGVFKRLHRDYRMKRDVGVLGNLDEGC